MAENYTYLPQKGEIDFGQRNAIPPNTEGKNGDSGYVFIENILYKILKYSGKWYYVKYNQSPLALDWPKSDDVFKGLIKYPRNGLTPYGGNYQALVNKTGSPSVKGTIIQASADLDFAFEISVATPTSQSEPFGIVYDNGIPDGSICRIVKHGIAQVLLVNETEAIRLSVAKQSTGGGSVNGRAFMNEPASHSLEIGHCIEQKDAGAPGENVLATAMIHFG